jgi:transmembrane sensor
MKQSGNTIDTLLSEQAAGWFVRLIANDLTLRERREYLAWLKQSSRHVAALLDIYQIHGYGRKAKLHSRMFPEPDPGANVIPFAPRGGVAVIPQQRQMQRPRFGIRRFAAVLAGIAFIVVLGFVVNTMYFETRISTGPGEWDQKLLADGSVLRVGPNTRVRWVFNDRQRTIVLGEGEAMFEVMKDPQRPFIVTTDIGDVRAVGTEFGVSLLNGSVVVVTVAHGKVAVSKPNKGRFVVNDQSGAVADQSGAVADQSGAVTELIANQQLVMSLDKVEPVKQVDASHELQWASGYYEFRDETVDEAVVEFNRRNRKQIVIDDADIGAIPLPFTTAALDDPDSFAVMLAARSDVRVAYEKSGVIRLKRE